MKDATFKAEVEKHVPAAFRSVEAKVAAQHQATGDPKLGAINWAAVEAQVAAALPVALNLLEGSGILAGPPAQVANAVVAIAVSLLTGTPAPVVTPAAS